MKANGYFADCWDKQWCSLEILHVETLMFFLSMRTWNSSFVINFLYFIIYRNEIKYQKDSIQKWTASCRNISWLSSFWRAVLLKNVCNNAALDDLTSHTESGAFVFLANSSILPSFSWRRDEEKCTFTTVCCVGSESNTQKEYRWKLQIRVSPGEFHSAVTLQYYLCKLWKSLCHFFMVTFSYCLSFGARFSSSFKSRKTISENTDPLQSCSLFADWKESDRNVKNKSRKKNKKEYV